MVLEILAKPKTSLGTSIECKTFTGPYTNFNLTSKRIDISGGTRALASARDFFVARFSLQTTPVLRVNNVISIHGWSEMKTVLQEIASTREC